MRKSRYTDEQMVKILREADRSPVADVWCPLGFRTAQAANFSRYSTGVR